MPPLISTQSVTKSFGARPLFSGITLAVGDGERIGLIGVNGSGKSTLLRLMAGLETPDSGEISRRRNLRAGFVAQEDEFGGGLTVESVLRAAVGETGGDEIEHETRLAVILGKVGFGQPEQAVETLSGGWRKRLAIAAQIIREPDLLLLDEPTNHLDITGIAWLEGLLATSPFSCVLISHDRYFLERAVNRIVELGPQYPDGYLSFGGGYSDFLAAREEFLAAQSRREESLTGQVRREIEWLRRGPQARATKSKYRIDEAGKMIEDLADLRDRNSPGTVARLDFSASGRKTKELIAAKDLKLAAGGRVLVSGLDLTLSPKMRLGVIGANGSGKTTLLQTLAGEREPDGGAIRRADRLRTVYFSQDRAHIPRELSLRAALAGDRDTVVYNGAPMHVSGWAKRFLFRPEQLDVIVDRLSGGEQARVLIARLMLEPADVLILDEPTNDLDIPTLDVLEESLVEFPGALVLVTHDRYVLDRVSTEILALDGAGGARYYADYYQWETREAEGRELISAPAAPPRGLGASLKGKGLGEAVDEARGAAKTFRGLTRPEQRELDRMEETISKAEGDLAALEAAMAKPEVASDYIKLQELIAAADQARAEIDALYARWQELEAKVEA